MKERLKLEILAECRTKRCCHRLWNPFSCSVLSRCSCSWRCMPLRNIFSRARLQSHSQKEQCAGIQKRNSCWLCRVSDSCYVTHTEGPFHSCIMTERGKVDASLSSGRTNLRHRLDAVLLLSTTRTRLHHRGVRCQVSYLPSPPQQHPQ